MGKRILLACDESPHSRTALDTAVQVAVDKDQDELHLLTVLSPSSASTAYPVTPVVPMASTATASVPRGVSGQHQNEKQKASETLNAAATLLVNDYQMDRTNIYMHVLPAAGGASGVSESIVEYAVKKKVELVIVGSRGMGTIKRSMLSIFGLGSVSDALLTNGRIHCPVLLVKHHPESEPRQPMDLPEPPAMPESKNVFVAYDNSSQAKQALDWTLRHILKPLDRLYLAVASIPVPFPVLDEPATAVAMESRAFSDEMESARAVASHYLEQACDRVVTQGFPREQVSLAILQAVGGPSDAGAALAKYAKENGAHVMVVGNRGLGAWQRSLMGFVGLGSVSQYLAHHLECAVAVVKAPQSNEAAADDLKADVAPEAHGKEAFVVWHG